MFNDPVILLKLSPIRIPFWSVNPIEALRGIPKTPPETEKLLFWAKAVSYISLCQSVSSDPNLEIYSETPVACTAYLNSEALRTST